MYDVLLVDDQLDIHRLIGHLLGKQLDGPVTMHSAMNEAEALAAVQSQAEFDVVLLDLCLPDFTGLDLLRELLATRPGLAVIVVSGMGSEQVVVEALEAGAMSYLDKPSLSQGLAQTVRKVVDANRANENRRKIHERLTSARYYFELDNDPALIPAMLDEVREVFLRFGIGGPNPSQLLVGIEEALANAMYHGNLEIGSELKHTDFSAFYDLAKAARQDPRLKNRQARISLEVREGTAWVTISDDGPGFDPTQVPDPTLPENLAKSSGRGLLLMRAFFDEVVYNNRGNEVTLVATAQPRGEYLAPDTAKSAAA